MKSYDAYHITKIRNIESIAKNGLLPNCGENSISVGDKIGNIFFTTYENIDFWIQRFDLKKSEIVVLNFIAENEGNRIHDRNDFCTNKSIPADQIYVVTDEGKIPIKEFYLMNKVEFEKLNKENIISEIEKVLLILRNVLATPDKKYTVDDLSRTLDLLAAISTLDDRIEFQNYLMEIKKTTLQLLKINGIDESIENYRLIENLFVRIFNKSEKILVSEIYELKQRIVHGLDFDPKILNDIRLFKM